MSEELRDFLTYGRAIFLRNSARKMAERSGSSVQLLNGRGIAHEYSRPGFRICFTDPTEGNCDCGEAHYHLEIFADDAKVFSITWDTEALYHLQIERPGELITYHRGQWEELFLS